IRDRNVTGVQTCALPIYPWSSPETVILHHGNAKSGKLWYRWVPLLARDYRVIRVDARGFGRSSVPAPGYPWSLEGFATDLLHLMEHLGIDKAHLIGETIGGTIALEFAHRYPDRLRTVTTCTSPYKFRGVQAYLDYHKIVKEQGVEGQHSAPDQCVAIWREVVRSSRAWESIPGGPDMGDILGIGTTHYPPGLVPDELKPWPLARMLQSDPRIPAHLKDPASWPEPMRAEWGNDEGISAFKAHRERVFRAFRAQREEIDAFR